MKPCFDGATTRKYNLHDEDDIDPDSDVAAYFEPIPDPREKVEPTKEEEEWAERQEEKEEEKDLS